VGKPSSGRLSKQVKLSWFELVQIALELTIRAYQKMLEARVAQKDWEENVFTIRLGEDYLAPIIFDLQYPLRISIREKVHTREMKSGKKKTITAKEIDLSLYDVWDRDYLKRRFIWEAKRVGDKAQDKGYENLNSEYVNEAIYRFINIEYADGLNDAGILGYVLAGNATKIVADINQTMSQIRTYPALSSSNHLLLANPINGFRDIFSSVHTRIDSTNINLYHLFLTFGFEESMISSAEKMTT
jgi:hypothetical protein